MLTTLNLAPISTHNSTLVEHEGEALLSAYLGNGSNDHTWDRLAIHRLQSLPSNYKINDGNIHTATITWKDTMYPRGRVVVGLDDLDSIAQVRHTICPPHTVMVAHTARLLLGRQEAVSGVHV